MVNRANGRPTDPLRNESGDSRTGVNDTQVTAIQTSGDATNNGCGCRYIDADVRHGMQRRPRGSVPLARSQSADGSTVRG
jgi:hypothetical protein